MTLHVLALVACGKDKVAVSPQPSSTKADQPIETADGPEPAPVFCIVELAVEEATPPTARIAGLEAGLAAVLPTALTQIASVVAAPHGNKRPTAQECRPGADPRGRVGVALRFDYTLLDGELAVHSPAAAERADLFHLAVMAHAERRGPDGRPEIAQAHVSARVPMPARHAANLAGFAKVRLMRASGLAVTDALGQLWVRRMSDAQILDLLPDSDPFKRAAAVREVGERGILAARQRVEKAALGSRRNLAVVAAAALGRLGQAASLPTLRSCLAGPSPEVADAALVAISEIADPAAQKILEETAREHPQPWIRQRASALLER